MKRPLLSSTETSTDTVVAVASNVGVFGGASFCFLYSEGICC